MSPHPRSWPPRSRAPGLSTDHAAGLDLILEGFLLHHGRPRHLDLPDIGRRVLAGDYCYAHGLVWVAETGDLRIIELLADLVAMSAALVSTGDRDGLPPLWRTTIAAIAHDDPVVRRAPAPGQGCAAHAI